jgi:predicted Rossmann-fold nucleotide-binding protein
VDGYVVMRGGMGTLAELTFTWQKLWLKMLPARPCILVGRRWQRVLDSWLRNLTVETSDYKCLTVAETPERACAILNAHFGRENASAIK